MIPGETLPLKVKLRIWKVELLPKYPQPKSSASFSVYRRISCRATIPWSELWVDYQPQSGVYGIAFGFVEIRPAGAVPIFP